MKKYLNLIVVLSLLIIPIETVFAQANSAESIRPLKVGQKAPAVEIKELGGESKKLAELVTGKGTLVIFFRGGWCPYCNLHLGELQKIEAELKQLGVNIVALSPDKSENLLKSVEERELSYQLFSDSNHDAAKAFGVAYKVQDPEYKKLLGVGVDSNHKSGAHLHLLPVPSAFLLDKNGTVKFMYANPDFKVRVDSNVILAEAKKLE